MYNNIKNTAIIYFVVLLFSYNPCFSQLLVKKINLTKLNKDKICIDSADINFITNKDSLKVLLSQLNNQNSMFSLSNHGDIFFYYTSENDTIELYDFDHSILNEIKYMDKSNLNRDFTIILLFYAISGESAFHLRPYNQTNLSEWRKKEKGHDFKRMKRYSKKHY